MTDRRTVEHPCVHGNQHLASMNLGGKRLMVVGGAGFVGSHLVDQLLASDADEVVVYGSLRSAADNLPLGDPRLRCIEGSVTNAAELEPAMEGIDGVFLLASLWMKECASDPRRGFDVNVHGGFNALDASRRAGVERIVYASSTAVYGEPLSDPVDETHPLNATSFYGATKIAVEAFLRSHHDQYGLPYVICRMSQVYGPRQATKGDATSVIVRFLDRLDAGEPPIIFGTGEQSFDFVDVEDVARALVLAMQHSEVPAATLNVASGRTTSLNDLARLLSEMQGSTSAVEYRDADKAGAPSARIDVTQAERTLGFRARIALEEGLGRMTAWRSTGTAAT